MGLLNKKDKSVQITAPKEYTLHGVKIHKLPIVKYVQVMEAAENLPALLLGEAFPDVDNFADLVVNITKMDRSTMLVILARLFKVVPVQLCDLLSQLLDIPRERLLEPKCSNPLSLTELLEIINAFIDINDLASFFTNVRSLKTKLTQSKESEQNTGSSVG